MLFSAIRKRLTPATVIATIALVLAMSGGAYAAGKYLITSTKQISPKVLKSLQGRAGARGATGLQGPAGAPGAGSPGPQGSAGAAGPKGDTGATGATGAPGAPGTNGKNGTNGKEGSPWTAGGTLPSGKTETGAWAVAKEGVTKPGDESVEVDGAKVIVSFPIPLAKALRFSEERPGEPANQVHYINQLGKEVPTVATEVASHPACPGTAETPEALPGNLCIYTGVAGNRLGTANDQFAFSETITDPGHPGAPGTGTTGALMSGEPGSAAGTWAVTAE